MAFFFLATTSLLQQGGVDGNQVALFPEDVHERQTFQRAAHWQLAIDFGQGNQGAIHRLLGNQLDHRGPATVVIVEGVAVHHHLGIVEGSRRARVERQRAAVIGKCPIKKTIFKSFSTQKNHTT